MQHNSAHFVYDEAGALLTDNGNGNPNPTDYVYVDGRPLALVRNGSIYYVHSDQLGTPRAVTAAGSATPLWSWSFAGNPFGEQPPTGSFINMLRFPGQYYDPESGLHYNYFRDYEPGTGRYVESDPIGLSGGKSTYSYVLSRPFTNVDTEGLAIWICGRAAFGGWLGNHAYLWDDKDKRCCGMNHGHDPLTSCKEKGPPSDSCRLVRGSDGREEQIMDCCHNTANNGIWPLRDYHDAANDCVIKAGLENPGVPGGRFGTCKSCWIQPPEFPFWPILPM